MPIPVDQICPWCGECDNVKIGVELPICVPAEYSLYQRLHRKYSLTTKEELLDFLRFAAHFIPNATKHVHYQELVQFASRYDILDWSKEDGRFMEAIFHFVADCHLERCHLYGDRSCHQLRIRVDNGFFQRFSRSPECPECWHSGVESSRNDEDEKDHIRRLGDFELIRNPLHACTVHILLAPETRWPPKNRARCESCHHFSLDYDEYFMGRDNLFASFHHYQTCICRFFCLTA